ncbi:JAB domain-containing protein [Chitinophaga rhizosphaerae]|uniref:JAB domain-containing protein n=1 Tax=Chitinophaga rhizosphaerae TaxID=1864947 RepID=UPI000F8102A0|nr:JAB domain-containing protein [Chitinophaga rhizosphaerae]
MEKVTKVEIKESWLQISEIDISFRNKVKASQRPIVSNSHDLFALLKSIWDMDTIELREEVKVIYLNSSNRVLGVMTAFKGGIENTMLDIRLVLAVALKSVATRIVVAHNHPSGSLTPSLADRQITGRLKDACNLLSMKLLDHIILSGDGEHYYSMADDGEI